MISPKTRGYEIDITSSFNYQTYNCKRGVVMKVLLDPGHGGHDSGSQGNGLKEKDIVLDISLKVGKILKRHGVDVIYSRTTDEFIQLSWRAELSNQAKVDAFVSLHCNAYSDSSAQGVEVFSYPGSEEGKDLALHIINHMVGDKVYSKNRGIKTDKFAVLRLTAMPAALVELGFITNAEDASILKNKQDELAIGVAKGILAFLARPYKEDHEETYKRAVENLVQLGIIGLPELWLDTTSITSNNIRSLIIKMAAYMDQ